MKEECNFTRLDQAYSDHDHDETSPLAVLRLLVSAEPDAPVAFFEKSLEKDGRFVPRLSYLAFGGFERISTNGNDGPIALDPFATLRQGLEQKRVNQSGTLPPFGVGAIGYFSYDSVRHLEPILKEHAGSFRRIKEDSAYSDAELYFFEKWIVFDHVEKRITFIRFNAAVGSSGFSEYVDLLVRAKKGSTPLKAFNDAPTRTSIPEIGFEQMKCSFGREKYKAGVKQLKEHIIAGDIFQAVLAERFELETAVTPFRIFEVLLSNSPSMYPFYFSNGKKVLLGASPEMLLSVKGRELETHPIAGTRPRGHSPLEEKKLEQQLRASVKENAEHLMLVDLARNDLGRIAEAGSVRVPERNTIRKFPSVMHLVSRVTARLRNDLDPIGALASCFPAGTLSGAPKVRAMQLLSEIEGRSRGFYGGAFALAGFDGDLEACISIRAMEMTPTESGYLGILQAGAGIVADSRPDFEYDEILHKTRALRQAIAIARELDRAAEVELP